MKFDETVDTLIEKFTQHLYHYTTPYRAKQILQDNYFRLSHSKDEPTDDMDNGVYDIYTKQVHPKYQDYFYLSTSRTKVGAFAHSSDLPPLINMCIIELDGLKLSSKYKIFPVSYYSKDTPIDESEDRVFSKTSRIQPASRYIVAIHLFISDITLGDWRANRNNKRYKNTFNYTELTELQRNCNDKKIPFYVYDRFSRFRNLYKGSAYSSIDELTRIYFNETN